MFGCCDATAPSLACICAPADDKLFKNILCKTGHLLHPLFPPERRQHYREFDTFLQFVCELDVINLYCPFLLSRHATLVLY
jgi:hypothetical protein